MKRIYTIIIIIFLCVGCAPSNNENAPKDDTIVVTTTSFPIYNWINIITDNTVKVDYILGSNTNLHDFKLTSNDIIRIQESDLFLSFEGDFNNIENVNYINIADEFSSVLLDIDHTHHHDDEHEHEHEHEHSLKDIHIWTSLNISKDLVLYISDLLIELDPANSSLYTSNTEEYLKEFDNLINKYPSLNDAKTLILADQMPFRYVLEDLNISYRSPFHSCSSTHEIGFEVVKELIDIVNSEDIETIFTIENTDKSIAEQIARETNVDIKELNSMQSINTNEIDKLDYLDIMESNLEKIMDAVSQ